MSKQQLQVVSVKKVSTKKWSGGDAAYLVTFNRPLSVAGVLANEAKSLAKARVRGEVHRGQLKTSILAAKKHKLERAVVVYLSK